MKPELSRELAKKINTFMSKKPESDKDFKERMKLHDSFISFIEKNEVTKISEIPIEFKDIIS
ncbi:MAG: hypothetical protein WCK78_04290 [Paludibacter sp.]